MELTISKAAVPAGNYRAKYLGGEELTTQYGEAYRLNFAVVGGDFDAKDVSRLVNLGSSSPKSNIVKFFAALAGVELKDGVHIDDEVYVGCEYELIVEDQGDDGYTRVGSIGQRLDSDDQTADEQAKELF
jgi:hypothetical protein